MDKAQFDKLRLLIEPCQTVDELDAYLRAFLKLELPWDRVDEESTSAPLRFVWDVYKTMLTGVGPTRHVTAAARNSAKTLTSSVLQYLSMLHFRRDGAHIAAILDQSLTSIRYLDQFLSIPELIPFRIIDNARTKRLINLPANDYTKKSEAALRVITATKKGANSPRANFLTLDEVDLVPREILSEVAYVADPSRCGHKRDPIFVYLSSRKSNDGPLQELIEKAESSIRLNKSTGRTKLHKWSTVDFMEKCVPEIHKPELGVQKAYLHTETLETIWGEDNFKSIGDSIKGQFREVAAFEGCKTCPAWIVCQGRSANQRGMSPMLRTRTFVGDVTEAVGDPQVIIAQSLNWKPETTALVFKTFSYHKNVKDPCDFYEWVIGKRFNPDGIDELELKDIEENGTNVQVARITPTKKEIYDAMVQVGYSMAHGVDWGYNPDPAVDVVIGFHTKWKKLAVLHVEGATGYANPVWAQYIAENVWPHMPGEHVAPDMADPASPSYFSKYNIPSLHTKPSRIETGVSFLRGLLWNPIIQRTSFCILDDSDGKHKYDPKNATGNAMMIEEFLHWTHKKTAMGWDFDKFDENKWNHTIDALRYAIDPFIQDIQITISSKQPGDESTRDFDEYVKLKQTNTADKARELAQNQFTRFFEEQHGLMGVFSKEEKMRALKSVDEANSKFGRKSLIETPEDEPPEPTKPPKSRLKYSF